MRDWDSEARAILDVVASSEAEPVDEAYAGDGLGSSPVALRSRRRVDERLARVPFVVEWPEGQRASTGHRVGEWHQRSRLSDFEVRAMRFLHASALALEVAKTGYHGCGGYSWLGIVFRCGASTARDIVKLRTRASA